jgi:hypothetical protein
MTFVDTPAVYAAVEAIQTRSKDKTVTISEHALNFADKPIQDWEPGTPLANPIEVVYRIACNVRK